MAFISEAGGKVGSRLLLPQSMLVKGLVTGLALLITGCPKHWAPDVCCRIQFGDGLNLLSKTRRTDFVFSRSGQPTLIASGHVVLTFPFTKLLEMDAGPSVIHQTALRRPQVAAASSMASVSICYSGRVGGQLL